MNTEISIMPVNPGGFSKADISTLRKANFIVIECSNPEKIKLIRPTHEIGSSEMIFSAMHALNSGKSQSAELQRESYTKNIYEILAKLRSDKN